MREYKVYLAGPIAGRTYDESEDWRRQVAIELPPNIVPYSPLRAKEYLRDHGVLGKHRYDVSPLSIGPGVIGRDHNDVKTADAVLMNLLGTTEVSIGAVIEAAWCYAYRVPLILVIEERDNIHEHLLLNEIPIYRTADLRSAVWLLQALLLPLTR